MPRSGIPPEDLYRATERIEPVQVPQELADFLVKLGGSLLQYGSPAHRIEEVLTLTAQNYGFHCEVFAVPTGLWVSLSQPNYRQRDPVVRMTRVYGWNVDLGQLQQLDNLFNRVISRSISLDTALVELEALSGTQSSHPFRRELFVSGAVCGLSAFFFGGGVREVAVGILLGFLVVLLMRFLRNNHQTRLLIDFSVGLLTGLVVWGASLWDPSLLRKPMLLAGIILIVPGMTLTVGLGELAHKQLVSGGSRLLHAAMVFVSMVLGLAVAIKLESWWMGAPVSLGLNLVGQVHPFWLTAILTIVTGLAFADLFFVPRKYMLWAAGSCVVAWLSFTCAAALFSKGPLAAFGGALGLGLYANMLTRWTDSPGQIFLLPGLILLVPGTIGFLGFERFLNGDPTQGTLFFFATVMNAGALIIGLIMASAALSPRKLL